MTINPPNLNYGLSEAGIKNVKLNATSSIVIGSAKEISERNEVARNADAILNGGGLNYFKMYDSSYSKIRTFGEAHLNYDKFDFALSTLSTNRMGGTYAQIDSISTLNSAGKSKFLDTPIGQMEIFLDLEGDNDKYGVGKVGFMGQLINLDNNRDGYLDADDEFFDKLKLKGYNSSGEEVILKLSDVYGALDLTKFVKTQKEIDNKYVVSGTTLFRPEESYDKVEQGQLRQLFKNYGDKDGWIQMDNLPMGMNFAYKKLNLDGSTRLQAFSIGASNNDKDKTYIENIQSRFNAMYLDYYAEDSFASRFAIKQEFQTITGMQFSEAKFKEFYEGLNNPKTAEKYANALKDMDAVVAMQLNADGSFTLKFDSGRTLEVAELYSTNGEFNLTQKGERASVMSEASSLNEEELNKLDFTQVGMQTDNGIVSLADLGIQFIQKEMFANGKIAFVLTKGNGSTLIASDLYKIRSVENMLLFEELEEKDKLHPRFETEA
ncbi:hypothetical protein [Helicobacter turcicus]|uniref:Uncharacterized protein n=1 Tax=Helicobacter turcicus TaxID=2867412 RepID=A0ABS7JMK5_9HELI|nr:hypothetical protein [Helicobacter turcicus]MBX7490609.1 hypothetical protein [Helicobacter turcicus]MBX7545483.1 hypothetical protein [Helicobacter turcicus]